MGQGAYTLDDLEPAPTKGQYKLDDVEGPADTNAPSPPSLWEKANTGLVPGSSLLNFFGNMVPRPPDMHPGETPAQYIERGKTFIDPNHPTLAGIRAGLSGTVSDVANTVSSFTSPVSLALAGTGVAARALPATGKAAMAAKIALRGAEAGAGTTFGLQGVKQAVTADWSSPEGIAQGLQGAGQAALGTAGVLDVAKAPFRQFVGLKSGSVDRFANRINPVIEQGDPVVNPEPVMKAIREVQDLDKKGFAAPKVISDFDNWITNRSKAGVSPEGIDTPGTLNPLEWKDARDFYSAMNDSIDWKNTPDKMQRAVIKVRGALDNELRATAARNGVAGEYDTAMKDYAKSMRLEGFAGPIGKIIGRAVGYTSPVHPWATGHVGAQVGGNISGSMVRSVLEATPEQYTRTLLEAKEGKISPGEADRRISKAGGKVKVKPSPRPPGAEPDIDMEMRGGSADYQPFRPKPTKMSFEDWARDKKIQEAQEKRGAAKKKMEKGGSR